MRKQIAKAIARRSGALRTALSKYNELAPQQQPPRPQLEYADVLNYAWLGDFVLLKYSRHPMLQKPWSVQSNREIASKHFKIIRAHKEINRLNVEIRQLARWIDDEDQHFKNVATTLTENSSHLAAELSAIASSHRCINDDHHARLKKVYCLNGYTGWKPPPALNNACTEEPANGMGIRDIINTDDDNALCDEVQRLTDFFDAIP
jgi:hypothetical protein